MRVARVKVDGQRSTAVINGRIAHLVSGNVFGAPTPAGEAAALSRVAFPVPARPSKIHEIAIGDESRAGDRPAPPIPRACIEGSNTPIAHGVASALPADAANVRMEVEVVAVIGKRAKELATDEGAGVVSSPFVRAK